jgi:hypothetical protein
MFQRTPQSNDSFLSLHRRDGELDLKLGQGFARAVIYLILALSGFSAIPHPSYATIQRILHLPQVSREDPAKSTELKSMPMWTKTENER